MYNLSKCYRSPVAENKLKTTEESKFCFVFEQAGTKTPQTYLRQWSSSGVINFAQGEPDISLTNQDHGWSDQIGSTLAVKECLLWGLIIVDT